VLKDNLWIDNADFYAANVKEQKYNFQNNDKVGLTTMTVGCRTLVKIVGLFVYFY